MSLFSLILEAKTELGKGSSSGREKMLTSKKRPHGNPLRSRVKVYPSIKQAVCKGKPGEMFTTANSDRLYVITKRKWGTDDEQECNGRVAKGFSPGSIPSDFSDVKRYAVRTSIRHGGGSNATEKAFKSKLKAKEKPKD
jgi:hypothetical protein